jgi:predicted enzyme related to lactoylglutathione lyase
MANKVMWYEVLGQDAQKLKGFFGELFGWQFKETPGIEYGMTNPEATGIGGGVGSSPQKNASWTTFYVGVENIGAALDKAQRLGGSVLMPVTKLPDVTIAVFADPEGHPVGLVEQKS